MNRIKAARLTAFVILVVFVLSVSVAYAQTSADTAEVVKTPANFRAAEVTSSSVVLEWDAVPDADTYVVMHSKKKSSGYKKLATVTDTALTHSVSLGTSSRYYVVYAVSGRKSLPKTSPIQVNILDAEYAKAVNPACVIEGLAQKYLNAINADRKANGLKALQYREALSKTAMIKAADMHKEGYFYADHRSPTYGSPSEMGQSYLGYQIAENIMDATGPWYNTYADAADCARSQFMASDSHRATRLDKNLKYVGFAMYYDGDRLCIAEHFSIK